MKMCRPKVYSYFCFQGKLGVPGLPGYPGRQGPKVSADKSHVEALSSFHKLFLYIFSKYLSLGHYLPTKAIKQLDIKL